MRATSSGDRVLLADVKILTFRRGQKTTHRRVDAVQQLICDNSGPVGCPKKKEYLFEDATCINEGIGDNMMPRWSCTASSLPKDTELGSVNVSCEGYTYRDDPYVLEGSCAMEYTLTAPTPQGPFAAFLIAFMGFFAFCVCCNKRKPVGAVEKPGRVRPPRAGAPPAYHAATAPSSSSSLPLAHAVHVDDLEKNAAPSFGKPGAGVAAAHPVGTAADASGPAESDGKHSSLGKAAAAGAAVTGAAAAGLAALASRNKHKKQLALPKGWEEKVDPASGGMYYLNHDTRETTWDDPREAGEHQHLLADNNAAAAAAAQENKWWNPLSMGNRLRPGVPLQAGRSAWQDYGHVPEQGEPSTFQGATTSGRGDGGGGGGGFGYASTTQGGTTGRGDGHASTAHGFTSGRDSGSGGWGGLFGGGGGGGSGHSSTAQGRTTGRGSSGGWGGGSGGGGGGTFGGTSGR